VTSKIEVELLPAEGAPFFGFLGADDPWADFLPAPLPLAAEGPPFFIF